MKRGKRLERIRTNNDFSGTTLQNKCRCTQAATTQFTLFPGYSGRDDLRGKRYDDYPKRRCLHGKAVKEDWDISCTMESKVKRDMLPVIPSKITQKQDKVLGVKYQKIDGQFGKTTVPGQT